MTPPPKKTDTGQRQYTFAPRSTDVGAATDSISRDSRLRRASRVVLMLVFFSIGVLVVGLVTIQQQEDATVTLQVEQASIDKSGVITLEGLSYRGTTENGARFVVNAAAASESTDAPNLVNMTRPEAEIANAAGEVITIASESGAYRRDLRTITLKGGFVIDRPDIGYTVQGSEATANLPDGIITSDQPVRGSGPDGSFSSGGIAFYDNENRIVLNRGFVIERADPPYTINGEEAVIDLANGVMTSDKPVWGTGPEGDFKADGMEFREANRELILTGNVQISITGQP